MVWTQYNWRKLSYQRLDSSDIFTNFFQENFPQTILSLSSWKWKQTSYGSKTGFFLSLPVEKAILINRYSLWKFVDSKFEIRDWWNYLMNSFKASQAIPISVPLPTKKEKLDEKLEDMKCSVCGKICLNWKNLEVHMLAHTNQNPFKCEVCGKGFRVSYRKHGII